MALGPIGQEIAKKLMAALKPLTLDVIDESHQHHGHAGAHPEGESHFRVRIVAPGFTGKMRVARHRMVNEVLAQELQSRVHALAIEALSPDEDLAFVELAAGDARLRDLLQSAGLPIDDLAGKRFVGMVRGGQVLVAAGGLDLAPPHGLLRSLAVEAQWRGQGLGRVMVIKLLGEARNAGVGDLYVLTANAAPFFASVGFEAVERNAVPPAIAETSQFSSKACASAKVMRLRLAPNG
jgi:BolA protein